MGGLSDFFGSKKDSGRDAGNAFTLGMNDDDFRKANQSLKDVLNYQGNEQVLDPIKSSQLATSEVQNNPMLAQLFSKGGTLDRTTAEEQNLAGRGYSLQPEDYEAYGQGAGQIAREFGAAEGGLAEALASRGLSSSGVANQAFMSSQGNKLEQLGQMQRKIANDRMQMNMQRLGQTRQFLNQMSGQAQNAIQDQYGRQRQSEADRFGQLKDKANAGQSWLSRAVNQGNEQLAQRAQTERTPGWAAGLSGFFGDAEQVAKSAAMGGMGKSSGGGAMSGNPVMQGPQMQNGQFFTK